MLAVLTVLGVPSLYASQTTPTIEWATPQAVLSGTELSAVQLDATAWVPGTTTSVSGTFVYSPAAGTIPAAGTDTLSVTFTPIDNLDYASATATVNLTVDATATTTLTLSSASVSETTIVTFTAAVLVNGSAVTHGLVSFCEASQT
jgi:hypothetical protein